MANANRPNGFRPKNIKDADCNRYVITAGQVLADGDMVSLDSAGTLVIGAGSPIAGVVCGNMIEYDTGDVIATATAGDWCMVWDNPNEVFIAQTSSFAATDPYTTASSASCFDIVSTTGAQYINAAASTQDAIKVLRLASEENGKKSVAGAYAKVECQINGLKHFRGYTA
jgi:hypothetical protein